MDPLTRGDPTSPLRWTCKSRAKLAAALTEQGWRVSSTTVGRLLHPLGYRLQSPRKRQAVLPRDPGHFAATRFVQPAYSAACVPYRWMLREKVEGNAKDGEIGLAERLKIGWVPDREPDIRNHQGKEVETDWDSGA